VSVEVAALAALSLVERDGGVTFEVRVQPRASRAAFVGLHGEAVKVALTAPPVDGAANGALLELVADVLGVPKRRVSLVRGEKSRQKVVRVADMSGAAVRTALARALVSV
jgi:uncharacterized protein (TIGR00251 family)